MAESDALEIKLLWEITKLNQRIKELEGDRRALERLLVRSRREDAARREVVRSSSGSRVIIETAISAHLRKLQGASATTAQLKVVAEGIELQIKDSTFRSHLHRLKQKDIIESTGHGRWRLKLTH